MAEIAAYSNAGFSTAIEGSSKLNSSLTRIGVSSKSVTILNRMSLWLLFIKLGMDPKRCLRHASASELIRHNRKPSGRHGNFREVTNVSRNTCQGRERFQSTTRRTTRGSCKKLPANASPKTICNDLKIEVELPPLFSCPDIIKTVRVEDGRMKKLSGTSRTLLDAGSYLQLPGITEKNTPEHGRASPCGGLIDGAEGKIQESCGTLTPHPDFKNSVTLTSGTLWPVNHTFTGTGSSIPSRISNHAASSNIMAGTSPTESELGSSTPPAGTTNFSARPPGITRNKPPESGGGSHCGRLFGNGNEEMRVMCGTPTPRPADDNSAKLPEVCSDDQTNADRVSLLRNPPGNDQVSRKWIANTTTPGSAAGSFTTSHPSTTAEANLSIMWQDDAHNFTRTQPFLGKPGDGATSATESASSCYDQDNNLINKNVSMRSTDPVCYPGLSHSTYFQPPRSKIGEERQSEPNVNFIKPATVTRQHDQSVAQLSSISYECSTMSFSVSELSAPQGKLQEDSTKIVSSVSNTADSLDKIKIGTAISQNVGSSTPLTSISAEQQASAIRPDTRCWPVKICKTVPTTSSAPSSGAEIEDPWHATPPVNTLPSVTITIPERRVNPLNSSSDCILQSQCFPSVPKPPPKPNNNLHSDDNNPNKGRTRQRFRKTSGSGAARRNRSVHFFPYKKSQGLLRFPSVASNYCQTLLHQRMSG